MRVLQMAYKTFMGHILYETIYGRGRRVVAVEPHNASLICFRSLSVPTEMFAADPLRRMLS